VVPDAETSLLAVRASMEGQETMIEKHEIKVSTTGSAGVASGSTILAVPLSELIALYLDYDGSAPGTTDVTISSPGNPAAVTILTESNNATDGWRYPRVQDHDNTGSAITGSYSDPPLHGNVLVEVAQGDAITDIVTVTIYMRV